MNSRSTRRVTQTAVSADSDPARTRSPMVAVDTR
jgi:hypothetical protein